MVHKMTVQNFKNINHYLFIHDKLIFLFHLSINDNTYALQNAHTKRLFLVLGFILSILSNKNLYFRLLYTHIACEMIYC